MSSLKEVQKGLSRGNAELAVQGLLKLAEHERASLVEPVGALFRAEVQQTQQRKDTARLVFWAARAEKATALLGHPGSPEALSTAWALLWGCIRAKEHSRAQQLFAVIASDLRARAPQLARALEALVSGDTLAPTDLPRLRVPERDPRLGQEPLRVRAKWDGPAHLEEVEPLVLGLFGLEPFGTFAFTLSAWAKGAKAPELRQAILDLGARLALKELVRRLSTGEAEPFAAAQLLADAFDADASAKLAPVALTAFRLLASTLPAQVENDELARPYGLLATAVFRYPEHRSTVIASLESTVFVARLAKPVLKLIERVVQVEPSPALVGKAMRLLQLTDQDWTPAPHWVQTGLSTVLEKAPEAWARWLERLDVKARTRLFEWASDVLPVPIVEAMIDRCWSHASSELQHGLAFMVRNLLGRIQDEAGPSLRADQSFGEFLSRLRDDEPDYDLPPTGRALWERQWKRILPVAPRLLGFSLSKPKLTLDSAREVISCCLADGSPIERYLDTLRAAASAGLADAAQEVENALWSRFKDNFEAIATGVLVAENLGAPPDLLERLAEHFCSLDAGSASASVGQKVEHARRVAHRYFKPKRKRSPIPRKKRSTLPKGTRAAPKGKKRSQSNPLPF